MLTSQLKPPTGSHLQPETPFWSAQTHTSARHNLLSLQMTPSAAPSQSASPASPSSPSRLRVGTNYSKSAVKLSPSATSSFMKSSSKPSANLKQGSSMLYTRQGHLSPYKSETDEGDLFPPLTVASNLSSRSVTAISTSHLSPLPQKLSTRYSETLHARLKVTMLVVVLVVVLVIVVGTYYSVEISTVYDVRDTIYDMRDTVYDVRAIIYDMRDTVYDMRAIVYDMRDTVYDMTATVYDMRAIVYDMRATVYDMRARV